MTKQDFMVGDLYVWESEGKDYIYRITPETFQRDDYTFSNFLLLRPTIDMFKHLGWKDTLNIKEGEVRMLEKEWDGDVKASLTFYRGGRYIRLHVDGNGNHFMSEVRGVSEIQHVFRLLNVKEEFEKIEGVLN